MPDWFYRTVSQPVLFRLSAERSRNLALGVMGRLARLPLGTRMIDFLGHMGPDPRLKTTILGITFPSPIGLGPALDAELSALPALARFGFGFLDTGNISLIGQVPSKPMERFVDRHAIGGTEPAGQLSVTLALPRIKEAARLKMPVFARLAVAPGATLTQATDECRSLMGSLAPFVHAFLLTTLEQALAQGWSPEDWQAHVRAAIESSNLDGDATSARPVLVVVSSDWDFTQVEAYLTTAIAAGVSGVLIDGRIRDASRWLAGLPTREATRVLTRTLREKLGPGIALIASGGVHEPEDAVVLFEAGADLVQLDTGLIFTGPGLPKRCNDLILFTRAEPSHATATEERPAEMTWFWTCLMGVGMLFGSIIALVIAATRVVLPYDEAFVGLSREQLQAINPRLLAFLAHDRISLAGSMIALGVLYVGLSWFGIRQGMHWAMKTVFLSSFLGFVTFFSFLGYGYLDPFHAFVAAALLQLMLMAVHCRLGGYDPSIAPEPRGDAAWRRGLWGQFLLIIHACGLLGAGLVISTIGMTHVVVHEDLEFMGTTAEALLMAHPRLMPLIAHDRATMGGMLLANGWAFLLPALWGFRRGSAWLWWTMLLAGLPAYAAALGVHFAVGYTNVLHLTPAFLGLAALMLGLGLASGHLRAK